MPHMMVGGVDLLAVGAASLAAFAVAGFWYSPLLFFKAWQAELGLTDVQAKAATRPVNLAASLVLVLIGAFLFARLLAPASAAQGALRGFAVGLAWVAASIGINYLFEGKSLKLFAINGGFHTVEFTLIGLILGFWR
ncbi:MAG TPA: DUF1761 domain-containing protein [Caulobacteraceae bacterium]|nr:DUF1761 domain-containing protein [Caulobacteraceae bacterium]